MSPFSFSVTFLLYDFWPDLVIQKEMPMPNFAHHIRRFLFISILVHSPSLSVPPLDSAIDRLKHIFHCTAVVIAVERQDNGAAWRGGEVL
jgi:hypothetical protein